MRPKAKAPPKKKKRGRGRPKAEAAPVTLQIFQGTKDQQLHSLYDQWYGCLKCNLGLERQKAGKPDDIVFGEGNPDAHILIIGEAPGEEEENTSLPFVGPSGGLLNQMLAMTAADEDVQAEYTTFIKAPKSSMATKRFQTYISDWRYKEFFITNVVSCRPPDNRTPTPVEVHSCWDRLMNIIYIVDPLLIIAVGRTALAAVLKKKEAEITKYRGRLIDVHYDGLFGLATYPVMPILHPSYLLRVADWKQKDGFYEKTVGDIRTAMQTVDFLRNQHFGTPIPRRERE